MSKVRTRSTLFSAVFCTIFFAASTISLPVSGKSLETKIENAPAANLLESTAEAASPPQDLRADTAEAAGTISILSPVEDGSGSYFSPYIIDSTEIRFKVALSGAEKENALYEVTVHMEHYRSCATQRRWENLTYTDILDREGIFTFNTSMAGWYYLRININTDGDFEEYKPARTHVYSRVPPVNTFSLPYEYPDNNHAPDPELTILNTTGGTGSHGDPFVINGETIRFRIDNTSDQDGSSDITNGVMFWAIQSSGHHPIYSGGSQIRNPADTFLYYEDFKDRVFTWDTTEHPSNDGQYSLHLSVIDQHGEKNEIRIDFTTGTAEPYDADLNQDGHINVVDVQICVNVITGIETDSELVYRADQNSDGAVNQSDMRLILSALLQ